MGNVGKTLLAGLLVACVLINARRLSAQTITPTRPPTLLQKARLAYTAGHYQEAEVQAVQVFRQVQASPHPQKRREATEALKIAAYAVARRQNYRVAQARFALLREMATTLPDRGAMPPTPNEPLPTLEEEGAFQYAVVTGAIGGQKVAEAEFCRFLRQYPQSILVHAAVKRVARYHGGDIPKEAERLWQRAMRLQHQQDRNENRRRALCGPECLAELIRRQGKFASVESLASEMRSSHEGTTLQALAEAARVRGWTATGYDLTLKGLKQQSLPAITLMTPGHYVLVEKVTPEAIRVWDPAANGIGKPGQKEYSHQQWEQNWQGITLVLSKKRSVEP